MSVLKEFCVEPHFSVSENALSGLVYTLTPSYGSKDNGTSGGGAGNGSEVQDH